MEEWDKLVSAAKGEGRLSVFTVAGAGYRKWMEAVQAALPGITVEHQWLPSSDQLPPKIVAERKAGVFSYDVLINSPVITLPRLRPEGVLDDLRPLLFRPGVLNDKAWSGGFEAGWVDGGGTSPHPLAKGLRPCPPAQSRRGKSLLYSVGRPERPACSGHFFSATSQAVPCSLPQAP